MPRIDNIISKVYTKYSPQVMDIIKTEQERLNEFKGKNLK